uniref:Uncharacterized protein n=1 Tax=Meloidogyne enterolobii TaxID=390850 RepID=A0A6V7WIV7_MELEN|nr:unnamed protein product [Meloidogyne enterolobii]
MAKFRKNLKNAKLIENEKLFDKNYLTGIFNKFWGHFTENRDVEGNVLDDAISIWKSFALNFKIPSNNGCLCCKKEDGKRYNQTRLNMKQFLFRRKRADPETGCFGNSNETCGETFRRGGFNCCIVWTIFVVIIIALGLYFGIKWLKAHVSF